MNAENIGQRVVVKDFENRAFIRRIVEVTGNSVFITSESGFKRLSAGEKTPWPIGVPLSDVYEYDGKPLPEEVDWRLMANWAPKQLYRLRPLQ